MSNLSLTGTQQTSLNTLQELEALFGVTQTALDTGRKVNSVSDNPAAYTTAQGLYDRSNAIFGAKSSIDQSIQSVRTALTGTSAVESLLQQLQGVVAGAQGGTPAQLASSTKAFQAIGQQIGQIVADTGYQGINLLSGGGLTTGITTGSAAGFAISGYDLTGGTARALFTQASAFGANGQFLASAVLGNAGLSLAVGGFSALATGGAGSLAGSTVASVYSATETRIGNAISQIQGIAANLGSTTGILQTQSNFSGTYANRLTSGADALTLADLNTEAALTEAANLRQTLAIQSLESSNRQNQAILTLLKT
jgi:flagellin